MCYGIHKNSDTRKQKITDPGIKAKLNLAKQSTLFLSEKKGLYNKTALQGQNSKPFVPKPWKAKTMTCWRPKSR